MVFMAGAKPICPWGFLASPTLSSSSPQRRTFAQALRNSLDVSFSQLPLPCIKGDAASIKISGEEYLKGLQGCKMNLHGHLLLSKGDKPMKFHELRDKLSALWKPIGQWRMTSLGKGYFEFSFSSQEDLRSVWSVGTWNVNPNVPVQQGDHENVNPNVPVQDGVNDDNQQGLHSDAAVRILSINLSSGKTVINDDDESIETIYDESRELDCFSFEE